MPEKFPIIGGWNHFIAVEIPNGSIPWEMIAPHEKQAHLNHDQSLAGLARRGGLSYSEAIAVLEDRDWHSIPIMEAVDSLAKLVKEWKSTVDV